jgi:hypothetical protein
MTEHLAADSDALRTAATAWTHTKQEWKDEA